MADVNAVAAPAAPPVPATSRPRRWAGRLPGIALAVGVVAAAGFFIAARDGRDKEAGEVPKAAASPSVVEFAADKWEASKLVVGPVFYEPWRDRVWRPGRVARDDDRVAHIYPPAEGIVAESPVRLGQSVRAGDVLAVLDCRDLALTKLDWLKAKGALAAERDQAARVALTMGNAKRLLDLIDARKSVPEIEAALADKPVGEYRQLLLTAYAKSNQLKALTAAQKATAVGVSEAIVRKTESEAEAASATFTSLVEDVRFQSVQQVRSAQVKLREAELAHDTARTKLLLYGVPAGDVEALDPVAEGAKAGHLKLRAPFDGVVVEKHAVLSERVGPTFQMFTVADPSKVWVQADVYESDLPLVRGLKVGSPLAVRSTLAGLPETRVEILSTGEEIAKATRALTITAQAANPDRALRPGMFVEVAFDTGDSAVTLQILSTAVFRAEAEAFVFVKSGDGEFRKAVVTLGRTAGDRVEVLKGLVPGDAVAMSGGFVLKSELFKDQMVGE